MDIQLLDLQATSIYSSRDSSVYIVSVIVDNNVGKFCQPFLFPLFNDEQSLKNVRFKP